MTETRVLIAAAGAGSRAGLPYPKTLHPVRGVPILVRLIRLLQAIDPRPAVVVSPSGRAPIEACLEQFGLDAELIEQSRASGMGDAVLQFREAGDYGSAEHLLLVWGDIPLLQEATIAQLRRAHFDHANDFTFVTRHVAQAYTLVSRSPDGAVLSLIETREAGSEAMPGERDIGLFLFRPHPVLELLDRRLPGALGRATGEHGFLYIVGHLVAQGCRVEALPIATEQDLVSLNYLSDLEGAGE